MRFAIILAAMMLSVMTGGAVQFSSNYTGEGTFSLFDDLNDNQVKASGDGSLEIGIDATANSTWAGIVFNGTGGMFATRAKIGAIHTAKIADASNISSEIITQEQESFIELNGIGLFSQAIYDVANAYGRHEQILDLDFEGVISMNTTVVDDTKDELLTTDITAEDM